MKFITLPIFTLLLLPFAVFGQSTDFKFVFDKAPTFVNRSNQVCVNGFVGGMASCQFSNIDLNFDGIQDLYVFDSEDESVMTFIGNGDKNDPQFVNAPQYVSSFPRASNWSLLVDFNKDGLPDIFSGNGNNEIMVYRNISENGKLKFELYNPKLNENYHRRKLALYASSADIPILIDMDNDGDLDVLTFEPSGYLLNYYQNQSVEKYGLIDSLDFITITACWGWFVESGFSNDIQFLTECAFDGKHAKKHAGSGSIALDYDNDGDIDLVVSDAYYNDVILLENGAYKGNGKMGSDSIVRVIKDYPPNSRKIDINKFPGMYLADINFDGKRDLVCTPNDFGEQLLPENTWAYLNKGTEKIPDFQFQTETFLQDQMIELGEYTFPALFDFDADGDLDMLVSAPTPYDSFNRYNIKFKLNLFENIGTKDSASFKLMDNDYLNLSVKERGFLIPSFGDIDHDGTIDLLLGNDLGRIMVYSNAEKPGKAASFSLLTPAFQDIKMDDNFAAPYIYDMDGDGEDDLLIGTALGHIQYWEYSGSDYVKTLDSMGNIYMGFDEQGSRFKGFAIPTVTDLDGDNVPDLMVTARDYGSFHLYRNIDLNKQTFVKESHPFHNELFNYSYNQYLGKCLSPAYGDLNNDGYMDLVLGNKRGGIMYASGKIVTITGGLNNKDVVNALRVYPNPVNGMLQLSLESPNQVTHHIEIMSMDGRVVSQLQMTGSQTQISTADFPEGIYLMKTSTTLGEITGVTKFVVVH